MEQRVLGEGGPQLSVVGLGCNNFGWRIDAAATAAVVHAALDAGSPTSTRPRCTAAASRRSSSAPRSARARDEVVIATKFLPRPAKDEPYTPGVLAAAHPRGGRGQPAPPRHRPHRPLLPALPRRRSARSSEALETLDELVRAGKVLHIASSNVSAEQIDEAAGRLGERGPRQRSAARRSSGACSTAPSRTTIVPAAHRGRHRGRAVLPAGLGDADRQVRSAARSSRRARASPDSERFAAGSPPTRTSTRSRRYAAFAAEHGHTVTELAIGWLLPQPSVTSVIAGATKPEQVAANTTSWTLSPAEAATVAGLGS